MKGNSLLLWVTVSCVGVDTITWTPAELHPVRSESVRWHLYTLLLYWDVSLLIYYQRCPNWGPTQEKEIKYSLKFPPWFVYLVVTGILWCHSEVDLWSFKYKMFYLHHFILQDICVKKKSENYNRNCSIENVCLLRWQGWSQAGSLATFSHHMTEWRTWCC